MKQTHKCLIAVLIVVVIVFSISLTASTKLKQWETSNNLTEAGAHAEYTSLKSKSRLAYNISNLLFLLTGFMALALGISSVIMKSRTKFLKSMTIPLAYLAITIIGLIITHIISGISMAGRYYLLYAIIIVVLAAIANLVITINMSRKSPDKKSKK